MHKPGETQLLLRGCKAFNFCIAGQAPYFSWYLVNQTEPFLCPFNPSALYGGKRENYFACNNTSMGEYIGGEYSAGKSAGYSADKPLISVNSILIKVHLPQQSRSDFYASYLSLDESLRSRHIRQAFRQGIRFRRTKIPERSTLNSDYRYAISIPSTFLELRFMQDK